MSGSDAHDPVRLRPIDIANLADEVILLADKWLTRDDRIIPLTTTEGPTDATQRALREEDANRREGARIDLIRHGKSLAAAIVHIVTDLSSLLKLLDSAERDDQARAGDVRIDAKVLMQQLALRCRSNAAQSASPSQSPKDDPDKSECLRTLDLLAAAIEDGEPGREIDGIRPLVWKLAGFIRNFGYERVPIQFDHEERDGWWTDGYQTVDPWGGHDHSVFLAKYKLTGAAGDQLREKLEEIRHSPFPEQIETVLRNLRAWRREIVSRPSADAVPGTLSNGGSADKPKLDVVAASNSLGDRQRGILLTLFQRHAFDRNTRMLTEQIAKLMEGPDAKPTGYKQPVADLSFHGYVESARGRDGGIWLTDEGRDLGRYLAAGRAGQSGAA